MPATIPYAVWVYDPSGKLDMSAQEHTRAGAEATAWELLRNNPPGWSATIERYGKPLRAWVRRRADG